MRTARVVARAFVSLVTTSHLVSALQVTPNSPCARLCNDSPELDLSDPNSSNTKNTDIQCLDAAHGDGSKWTGCMSCLQNSTFSQGSESDQMWFLYNMRFTLASCLYSFPNATNPLSTPCSTLFACEPLEINFKHALVDRKGLESFSYCSVGEAGHDYPIYDRCSSCLSSESKTEYLANYVVALKAGCQQRPSPDRPLGISDTVFSTTTIQVVDPLTLIKGPGPGPGMPTTTIAGIAAGAIVAILIAAAVAFICYRKRKNRRDRAYFESHGHSRRHRHKSSLSFQCQTHAMSPRFWPGAGEEALPTVNEVVSAEQTEKSGATTITTQQQQQATPDLSRRSSLWKPHNSISSFENSLEVTKEEAEYMWESPYQKEAPVAHHQKAVVPNIKTSVPTIPPQARMSPNSAATATGGMYYSPSDVRTPLSAESIRSTTALLPAIKPYIPAEHGVHNGPAGPQQQPTFTSPTTLASPATAFTSPVLSSGSTMSPLLKGYGWPESRPAQQQQAAPTQRSRLSSSSGIGLAISTVIPPPPPPNNSRVPRLSIGVPKPKHNNNGGGGTGTPVESWEIQTAFAGPPKR